MSFNDKHLAAWFAEGGSSTTGASSLAFLPEQQRATLLFVAERLETAFIFFCDRFRRSFIGETPAKSSVFKPLERVLGSPDEFSLLRYIVNKMFAIFIFDQYLPIVRSDSQLASTNSYCICSTVLVLYLLCLELMTYDTVIRIL